MSITLTHGQQSLDTGRMLGSITLWTMQHNNMLHPTAIAVSFAGRIEQAIHEGHLYGRGLDRWPGTCYYFSDSRETNNSINALLQQNSYTQDQAAALYCGFQASMLYGFFRQRQSILTASFTRGYTQGLQSPWLWHELHTLTRGDGMCEYVGFSCLRASAFPGKH